MCAEAVHGLGGKGDESALLQQFGGSSEHGGIGRARIDDDDRNDGKS